VLLSLSAATCAAEYAGEAPPWADSSVSRLKALALIETLNTQILASSSATLTLESWCQAHGLATPAKVIALRQSGAEQAPSEQQRQELQVDAQEPVRFRRVRLVCGDVLLSVADNWYVPSRLTPAMNALLEETQTPFGKVVLPLAPHRETLLDALLWTPLAPSWELNQSPASRAPKGGGRLELPATLFEIRAVLYTPDHQALAEVVEDYQRGILGFPEPVLP
jgi:chorismate-pyruvate lyase